MPNDRLEVISPAALATVDHGTLRACRTVINTVPAIQELFQRSDNEQWTEEQLAEALGSALPEYLIDSEGCPEVSALLAHEHHARDRSKLLIVSQDTGLPLAQLPSDAIYQPDPVAREGRTELAVPLPRLRPEYESAIVQSVATQARETGLVQTLTKKLGSNELQRQEGDNRLLVVTSRGRKQLLIRLQHEVKELLTDGPGAVGEFLRMCDHSDVIPSGMSSPLSIQLEAFTSIDLNDMLSKNYSYDPYMGVRDALRNQLARNLASQCVAAASLLYGTKLVSLRDALESGMMVGDANVAFALRHRGVLALEDGPAAVFQRGPHLNNVVMECKGREYAKAWEVGVRVDLDIRIPKTGITVYEFADVERSVEVL